MRRRMRARSYRVPRVRGGASQDSRIRWRRPRHARRSGCSRRSRNARSTWCAKRPRGSKCSWCSRSSRCAEASQRVRLHLALRFALFKAAGQRRVVSVRVRPAYPRSAAHARCFRAAAAFLAARKPNFVRKRLLGTFVSQAFLEIVHDEKRNRGRRRRNGLPRVLGFDRPQGLS